MQKYSNNIKKRKKEIPKRPLIERIYIDEISKWGIKRDQSDLDFVKEILPAREAALEEAINGLSRTEEDLIPNLNLTHGQIFALAATDVFVEKA